MSANLVSSHLHLDYSRYSFSLINLFLHHLMLRKKEEEKNPRTCHITKKPQKVQSSLPYCDKVLEQDSIS